MTVVSADSRNTVSETRSRSTLAAVDATKDFGGVRALKSVSIAVAEGEICGLIGPNGSGKTTLLNCLTGFIHPTTGTVTLDGEDITHRHPAQIARRRVARTFQNIRLFDRLTVLQNIEVNALAAGGLRRDASLSTARQLAEEFGLQGLLESYAADLSYGDRRRVEIARCLGSAPRFLLLDEPTAGMNADETAALGELIQQIRRQRNCGVLLVDHDLELITLHCDSITVLNEGSRIAQGDSAAIQSNQAVVTAYIGESLEQAMGERHSRPNPNPRPMEDT